MACILVAAACGGEAFPKAGSASTEPTPSGSAVAPRARLLSALQQTSAQKSARLSLDLSVSVRGSGQDGTVTGTATGAIDFVRRLSTMTLREHDPDGETTTQIRVVAGTVYLDSGDGWTSLPAGSSPSVAPEPNSYLDYLQGVSADVHAEGRDVVRGVDTTRYGATIDLARAVAATRGTARVSMVRALAVIGNVQIPAQVWIDDQGRMRKERIVVDLSAAFVKEGAPAGSKVMLDETFELYDFGVALDVRAPAGARSAVGAAQDRATQSDLRNALTAEKTVYTDNMTYSADAPKMREIEPSLGWGGRLRVMVGTSGVSPSDMVCLSEMSKTGTVFAIADVADGAGAGTYFGKSGCPAIPTPARLAALGSSW